MKIFTPSRARNEAEGNFFSKVISPRDSEGDNSFLKLCNSSCRSQMLVSYPQRSPSARYDLCGDWFPDLACGRKKERLFSSRILTVLATKIQGGRTSFHETHYSGSRRGSSVGQSASLIIWRSSVRSWSAVMPWVTHGLIFGASLSTFFYFFPLFFTLLTFLTFSSCSHLLPFLIEKTLPCLHSTASFIRSFWATLLPIPMISPIIPSGDMDPPSNTAQ